MLDSAFLYGVPNTHSLSFTHTHTHTPHTTPHLHTIASMATETDYFQSEPLLFADFGSFPELDDLPTALFLRNAIDSIAGGEFYEEPSGVDASKAFLLSEFNDIGTSLREEEGVDSRDMSFTSLMMDEFSYSSGFEMPDPQTNTPLEPKVHMPVIKTVMSVCNDAIPSKFAEEGEAMSPRTALNQKLNSISLHDMHAPQASKHALAITSKTAAMALVSSPLSPFAGRGHLILNACPTSTPYPLCTVISVLQIGSMVSSPPSATDGSHESILLFGLDNPAIGHPIELNTVTGVEGCTVVSGVPVCHTDVPGGFPGAIVSHLMEEASSKSPILKKSQSSHALGETRTLGHQEFTVNPGTTNEIPFRSFSNLGPYKSPASSMRRVYSTGDIQASNGIQGCCIGDAISALHTFEDRKTKLNRYRQKRSERNFSRKVKYACRKTLADSRLRIRGRFARMDDIEEREWS